MEIINQSVEQILVKEFDLKHGISEVVIHDISQDKIIKQIEFPQID